MYLSRRHWPRTPHPIRIFLNYNFISRINTVNTKHVTEIHPLVLYLNYYKHNSTPPPNHERNTVCPTESMNKIYFLGMVQHSFKKKKKS